MADQLDFDFPEYSEQPADGLQTWREQRRRQIERLARRQGLPLGRRVRVEFENGPPLEGLLVLNEELLFAPRNKDSNLHLRIGTSDFHANEIESCIRTD